MSQKLAEKIRQKSHLLGVILKMPAPGLVELVGALGFDLIVIDTEHGPSSGPDLEHHLRAADAAGIPALVRISSHRAESALMALDAGAVGIVFPHVSSKEDAVRAVAAAHYPPHGKRSLSLTTRSGRQGTISLAQHLKASHENTVVVVQIEDYRGMQATDDICSVAGVDAIWIGLNDLSLDCRQAEKMSAEEFESAVESLRRSVKSSSTALTISPSSIEDLSLWRSRGATVQLIPFQSMAILGARQFLDHHADREGIATPEESRLT